jgi:hypothetical protein
MIDDRRSPGLARRAQPCSLDAVDDLAGAARGDAQLGGDILHPAARNSGDDLYELERGKVHPVVGLQSPLHGVPQLGLEPGVCGGGDSDLADPGRRPARSKLSGDGTSCLLGFLDVAIR